MSKDENNSMLYGTLALATVVFIAILFQAKAYFAKPATEAEFIAHQRSTTAAPKEIANVRDFMESDRDLSLEQHVMDILREIDQSVRDCLVRWPDYPKKAKARIQTDNAGRLSGFAIQNAPTHAENCMITFLKNSLLPRHNDGVVHLEFPSQQEATTGPVHTPPQRESNGPVEIYWGQGEGQ